MKEKNMPEAGASLGRGAPEPPFAMPANSREVIISRAEALRVSLRVMAPSLVRIFILLLLLHICLNISYNGFIALSYPLALLSGFAYPAGGYVLFVLLFVLIVRGKVHRYRLYDVSTLYGFDEEALYSVSAYCAECNRWERFISWRELGAAFLLSDGVVQHMLPKKVWTGQELEQLRATLRNKVGKPLPSGVAFSGGGPSGPSPRDSV